MKFNQFSKAITVSLIIMLLAIAGITAISNPGPQKDSSTKSDKGRSATQKIAANPLDGGKAFKCLSGPDKCYCKGDDDCNKMKAKVCVGGTMKPEGGGQSCEWKQAKPGGGSGPSATNKLTTAKGGPQPYGCVSDGWKCFCKGTDDCKQMAAKVCLDDPHSYDSKDPGKKSCNWNAQ